MARSIAINVGANTNLPGFRGPIYPDGRFVYLPIPEREPTAEPVPTYGDLASAVELDLPEDVRDVAVHLDPAFPEYPFCDRYTYGDEHGLKAGPLSTLEPGDSLFFYATLSPVGGDGGVDDGSGLDGDDGNGGVDGVSAGPVDDSAVADWIPPDWGAFLIGEFRVASAVGADEFAALPEADRMSFAGNAHLKRRTPDAEVLVAGDERSRLFDRAVPLSAPDAGATANRLVTDLSNDSGEGPWWRRVLRFGPDATERLRAVVATGPEATVSD